MIDQVILVHNQIEHLNQKIATHEISVEKLRTKINTLKKEIQRLKQQGAELAGSSPISQEDLNKIYWETSINSRVLAKTMQIKESELRSMITPIPYGTCERCGASLCFTSRNQRILNSQRTVCTKCERAAELYRRNEYRLQVKQEGVEHQTTAPEDLKRMPYQEYLNTDHWKELRNLALKAAKYRCEVCDSDGKLNVHHKHYKTRGAESLSDLVVLCHDCHAKFHGKHGSE